MPISDSRKWPSNVRGEMLEREVKLAVDDNFDPATLSGVIGDWEIHRIGEIFLEATYYDTEDLRLLRSGMSLRFRDGWTIKLSQPSGQPELMRRLEVSLPGPQGEIPVRGRDLVRAAVRQERVLPVSRISTHRQLFAVRDHDGIDLAEVAFDEVVTDTEARTAAAFTELEIELDGSATAAVLGPIIARFRALGAGNAIRVSKFARSLGLTIMPEPVVIVPDLDARATAGEIVHASIARSVRRFLDHAPAVVLDEDPEGVHQARWQRGGCVRTFERSGVFSIGNGRTDFATDCEGSPICSAACATWTSCCVVCRVCWSMYRSRSGMLRRPSARPCKPSETTPY